MFNKDQGEFNKDMENIDKESIKNELTELFYLFLDNPGNGSAFKKAEEISERYSGLVSYSEHSSEEIISKDIIDALNSVEDILEYGLFEKEHPAFSNEKIINNIKNQLRKLSAK